MIREIPVSALNPRPLSIPQGEGEKKTFRRDEGLKKARAIYDHAS
jgi:hypothetical protein